MLGKYQVLMQMEPQNSLPKTSLTLQMEPKHLNPQEKHPLNLNYVSKGSLFRYSFRRDDKKPAMRETQAGPFFSEIFKNRQHVSGGCGASEKQTK